MSLKEKLGGGKGDSLEREINFAINKISERKIFSTDHNAYKETLNAVMRRPSVKKQKSQMINWLNEYSDVNLELNSQNSVQSAKRSSKMHQQENKMIQKFRRGSVEANLGSSLGKINILEGLGSGRVLEELAEDDYSNEEEEEDISPANFRSCDGDCASSRASKGTSLAFKKQVTIRTLYQEYERIEEMLLA